MRKIRKLKTKRKRKLLEILKKKVWFVSSINSLNKE